MKKNNGREIIIESYQCGISIKTYLNKGKKHRVKGPAVIQNFFDNKTFIFYFNDARHNTLGPSYAKLYNDGSKVFMYYVNDIKIDVSKELTKEELITLLKIINLS